MITIHVWSVLCLHCFKVAHGTADCGHSVWPLDAQQGGNLAEFMMVGSREMLRPEGMDGSLQAELFIPRKHVRIVVRL